MSIEWERIDGGHYQYRISPNVTILVMHNRDNSKESRRGEDMWRWLYELSKNGEYFCGYEGHGPLQTLDKAQDSAIAYLPTIKSLMREWVEDAQKGLILWSGLLAEIEQVEKEV